MSNKNNEAYLDRFLNNQSPQYGVMLDGTWGSGKTYFLKNYLEDKMLLEKFNKKRLWISLNGIETREELGKRIFFELHPKLKGKYRSLFAHLAQGLIGMINGDKLIKAFKHDDWINGIDRSVLIFDDFERCPIMPCSLLGYINEFIEQYKLHVIIVADEKNIKGNDNPDSEYKKRKEKVVGRTLKVQTEIKDVVWALTRSVTHPKLKEFLRNNEDSSLVVFNATEYNNFRLLKQTLLELDEVADNIGDQYWDNDVFHPFYIQYLLFNIEHKNGRFSSVFENLHHNLSLEISRRYTDDKKEANDSLYAKYESSGLMEYFDRSMSILINKLQKNIALDKSEISHYFDSSIYMKQKQRDPMWKVIENPWDRDETKFTELYNEMMQKFENGDYDYPLHLLQIADFQVFLSKQGLITDTPAQIIDGIIEKCESLTIPYVDWYRDVEEPRRRSTASDSELSRFEIFLREKVENAELITRNNRALEIMTLAEENFDDYLHWLLYGSEIPDTRDSLPILADFEIERFWPIIEGLNNSKRRELARHFANRYQIEHFPVLYGNEVKRNLIKSEEAFIKSISTKLTEKVTALIGSLNNSLLSYTFLKEAVEQIISTAEKVRMREAQEANQLALSETVNEAEEIVATDEPNADEES